MWIGLYGCFFWCYDTFCTPGRAHAAEPRGLTACANTRYFASIVGHRWFLGSVSAKRLGFGSGWLIGEPSQCSLATWALLDTGTALCFPQESTSPIHPHQLWYQWVSWSGTCSASSNSWACWSLVSHASLSDICSARLTIKLHPCRCIFQVPILRQLLFLFIELGFLGYLWLCKHSHPIDWALGKIRWRSQACQSSCLCSQEY